MALALAARAGEPRRGGPHLTEGQEGRPFNRIAATPQPERQPPSWGPLFDGRVALAPIEIVSTLCFRAVEVDWPRPRDAALTLGAALRGEPQAPGGPIWARTLEVVDADGEPVDRVAWHPAQPAKWWTMHGAPILGAAEIDRADYLGRPLLLCSTPERWLANYRPAGYWPAACILDWRCSLELWLAGPREIVADSLELERLLGERLGPGARPRFRVRRVSGRTAA